MWYDLLMLAILAFTTIRGAARGMAWQLAAIAALILCFAFATPLSLVAAPLINLNPPLNRWVAMLAIYLAFSFGCFSIARLLRGWLEEAKFTEYDRHLGALFGLLKGATLCLVITFFAVCLSETACHAIMQTRSGYLAGEVLEQLAVVMPAELQTVLRPHLRHFNEDHVATQDHPARDDRDEPGSDSWIDGDEGFRGSALPQNGPSDETGSHSGEPGDTDDPTADPRSHAPRGVLGQAVEAIGEKFESGVKGWLNDTLNPQKPKMPPFPENATAVPTNRRPDTERRAPGRADSLPSLIAAVAALFSTNPDNQADHRARIEALLQGVPATVSVAALRDWRADLLGTETDPDPETDAGAPLDLRLVRQLRRGGHSMDELARPLRERLREVEAE